MAREGLEERGGEAGAGRIDEDEVVAGPDGALAGAARPSAAGTFRRPSATTAATSSTASCAPEKQETADRQPAMIKHGT